MKTTLFYGNKSFALLVPDVREWCDGVSQCGQVFTEREEARDGGSGHEVG